MINYNLAGKALVHCLEISGAGLLLVDRDPVFQERIEEVRGQIEGELGMRIVILDEDTRINIQSCKAERPPDLYRERVRGDGPMALFYTR